MSGSFITMKEALTVGAYINPNKIAVKDYHRSMTFKELNERCCRLANGLLSLGLQKGDKIAMIGFNCVEWVEFYGAAAKAGLVSVPILFRLVPNEYQYVLVHSEAKVFIVAKGFVEGADSIRAQLPQSLAANFIFFGDEEAPANYLHYEDFLQNSSPQEPDVEVTLQNIWNIQYTSGTTGKPKGALWTHESRIAFFLTQALELGFRRNDTALLAMPMSHGNAMCFCLMHLYIYASVFIYSKPNFDPELFLRTIAEEKATFTSLVPTQYVMLLSLPEEVKSQCQRDSMRVLLCSSAPVRKTTKLEILEFFPNGGLFEGYGSTEAGLPVLLRPEDQLEKLGSIGQESMGTGRILILDDNGQEVPTGMVGEIYTKSPTDFDEYLKNPEMTQRARKGEYVTASDMGFRDENGYYYLVDRKQNMICTGGENVYPSEVENVVALHPAVQDVAVIGLPDEKWSEIVQAVVVLKQGFLGDEKLKEDIIEFSKGRLAGYKRPRVLVFVQDLPRTATGKVAYGRLREEYGLWSDKNK